MSDNTSFYEEKAQGALVTMLSKGLPLTVYRLNNEAAFDPVTGGNATPSILAFQELVGLTLPASKGTVQAFDDRIREELLNGKLRFFIFAAKQSDGSDPLFAPQAGDILFYPPLNSFFTVMGMTRFSPVGVDILYKLGCQAGCQEFYTSPGVTNDSLLDEDGDFYLTGEAGTPIEGDF